MRKMIGLNTKVSSKTFEEGVKDFLLNCKVRNLYSSFNIIKFIFYIGLY